MSEELQKRYDILMVQALKLANHRNMLEATIRSAIGLLNTVEKSKEEIEPLPEMKEVADYLTKELEDHGKIRRGLTPR